MASNRYLMLSVHAVEALMATLKSGQTANANDNVDVYAPVALVA